MVNLDTTLGTFCLALGGKILLEWPFFFDMQQVKLPSPCQALWQKYPYATLTVKRK
jgi:hypothetical protein